MLSAVKIFGDFPDVSILQSQYTLLFLHIAQLQSWLESGCNKLGITTCLIVIGSTLVTIISLAFKAKSRPECVSVCTNAFNNSDEFKGINKLLR